MGLSKTALVKIAMAEKYNIDLNQLSAGSKPHWDDFVEQYSALIYSVIRRILLTYRKDAGDWDLNEIFQEVFVKLIKDDYKLLRTYDPAKASLSTWLTIVTRSTAIDFLRKIPAQHQTLDGIDMPAAEEENQVFSSIDIPKHILTGRQKLVLELLFEKNLEVDEVAGMLGIDAQSVRSTKHKALEALRKYFKKEI